MKNRIFTGISIVLLCLATFAVQATGADKAFNDYQIVPVSNQELSGDVDKAWVLSYDETESPIVISLHQNKRSKHYVVRAEHFEVAYVCCKKGFGAKRVRAEYSKLPEVMTNQVINESELARQKILSPNELSEEDALNLIAAYLPNLVNPSYKHLLN